MTEGRSSRRGSSRAVRARWTATYETTPYQRLPWFDPDPSPQVVEALRQHFLTPGGTVLDLGCGAGSNVLYLAREGFEAHGVDLSPGAIRAATERARSDGVKAEFHVGDVLSLDYRAARFDGLLDNGCFHTLPVGRRRDYAREAARVLRPEGSFVLSWIAREHVSETGPPHRPSLAEVAAALEERFLFVRTSFHAAGEGNGPSRYVAWLRRRATPQPPRR